MKRITIQCAYDSKISYMYLNQCKYYSTHLCRLYVCWLITSSHLLLRNALRVYMGMSITDRLSLVKHILNTSMAISPTADLLKYQILHFYGSAQFDRPIFQFVEKVINIDIFKSYFWDIVVSECCAISLDPWHFGI